MIEFYGTIELRHNRRQLDPEPTFGGATPCRFDPGTPRVPPSRDNSRNWFDDEDGVSGRPVFEEPLHQGVAGAVRELVQRERREDRRLFPREWPRANIRSHGSPCQSEVAIRLRGFA